MGGGHGAWSTAHDIRGYIPAGYKKITVDGLNKGATMSIGGVQVTNGVSYLEEPMIKNTEYDSYEYIFTTVYKSQATNDSNPGIVTLYASI